MVISRELLVCQITVNEKNDMLIINQHKKLNKIICLSHVPKLVIYVHSGSNFNAISCTYIVLLL